MKKIICIFILVILFFSISACSDNNTNQPETTAPITTNLNEQNNFTSFECSGNQFIFRDKFQYIRLNNGVITCDNDIKFDALHGSDIVTLFSSDYETATCAFIDGALFFRDIENNILYRMAVNFDNGVSAERPTVVYNGFAIPVKAEENTLILRLNNDDNNYISLNTLTGKTKPVAYNYLFDYYALSLYLPIDEKKAVEIADVEKNNSEYSLLFSEAYGEKPEYIFNSSEFIIFPDFIGLFGTEWRYEDYPEHCWKIEYVVGDDELTFARLNVYINASTGEVSYVNLFLED